MGLPEVNLGLIQMPYVTHEDFGFRRGAIQLMVG